MSKQLPSVDKLTLDSMQVILTASFSNETFSVIACVSLLDEHLRLVLERVLRKSKITRRMLDSGSGMAGSFVARANLLYVMSLVEKPVYQELLRLAELRNMTAHSYFKLDFRSPEVQERCSELQIPTLEVTQERFAEFLPSESAEPHERARRLFTTSVFYIWSEFRGILSGAVT